MEGGVWCNNDALKCQFPKVSSSFKMVLCNCIPEVGKKQRLVAMLLMTGSFMVTELIVGYCGDSLTLVADSFHMLNDVAALGVAFVTMTLTQRNWDRSTFGWARADVLGAMINSVFLLALSFSIFVEAMKRFVHPEPVIEPRWVFSVGTCGLIINLIGLFMFKDHAHNHSHTHKRKPESSDPLPGRIVVSGDKVLPGSHMNLRGVFLHILADTMASVAVIISAGIVWLTEDLRTEDFNCWKFIDYIDPALSILICCLIFASALPLLHQSSLILLQAHPATIRVADIKKELEEIEGVTNVHELHIWQLTGTKVIATAHLKCTNSNDYSRITREAIQVFQTHEIHSLTIQGEFQDSSVPAQGLNNNDWSKDDCLLISSITNQDLPSDISSFKHLSMTMTSV